MRDITNNEMLLVLSIFKSPEKEYNASSIAKKIGISPMGALKIARRLENEQILMAKKMGNAKFYKVNLANDYAREYLKFLLRREAEQAPPYIKRWISEIKKIKSADLAVLFGSVLIKQKEAKDIDILLAIDAKRFAKLKKEIEDVNLMNTKRLHPIYQTKEDITQNIKKGDPPLLNALKGIVVFGEDKLIELIGK